MTGGGAELLDTGGQIHCNNDHGISPDGTQLAISDQTQDGKSRIYVLPIAGGTPRLVTPKAPSYWHGWSPDGKTLAYCAERNGEFDIYTIPVEGGEETRLTTAPGLDDGPDYSPDGKYIYFNSERTGRMQIWRMKPDGSEQEQITSDDYNNWFAHPSPDGRWIVFLSYEKGRDRPSGQQGCADPAHVAGRRENSGAGEIVWRAGDNQRSFLVAGQPECGVRQLSIGLSVKFPVLPKAKSVTRNDTAPLPGFLRAQPDGTLLSIKLQPRASVNEIGGPLGDELRIKVTAPPVDAAANEALVELLAERLDCARGRVELVRGHKSRHKVVKLHGFTLKEVFQKLLESTAD